MSTRQPRAPKPTALRVAYLILGWVTAVGVASFVVVSGLAALTSADAPLADPTDSDKSAATFVLVAVVAMGLMAAHFFEQAGGDE